MNDRLVYLKRWEKDILKLQNSGFKVERKNKDENEIVVTFWGPKNTPYEKGEWKVVILFPDEYPYKSPSVGFINKIFHPNIDFASGSVCLDVLN